MGERYFLEHFSWDENVFTIIIYDSKEEEKITLKFEMEYIPILQEFFKIIDTQISDLPLLVSDKFKFDINKMVYEYRLKNMADVEKQKV